MGSCTKVCKTLINTGRCDDPDCKYAHSREEIRAVSAAQFAPVPVAPVAPVQAAPVPGSLQVAAVPVWPVLTNPMLQQAFLRASLLQAAAALPPQISSVQPSMMANVASPELSNREISDPLKISLETVVRNTFIDVVASNADSKNPISRTQSASANLDCFAGEDSPHSLSDDLPTKILPGGVGSLDEFDGFQTVGSDSVLESKMQSPLVGSTLRRAFNSYGSNLALIEEEADCNDHGADHNLSSDAERPFRDTPVFVNPNIGEVMVRNTFIDFAPERPTFSGLRAVKTHDGRLDQICSIDEEFA